MVPLTLKALDREGRQFDDLVTRTPGTDVFCSSTQWAIPAAESMMPPRTPYIFRDDSGYIALMKGFHPSVGTYLQPLEAAWCFSNGLISERPRELISQLAKLLREDKTGWDLVLLSGVKDGGLHFRSLVSQFAFDYHMQRGHDTQRHHADLSQGLDPYLGRRSPNFRRSLSKSRAKATRAGITMSTINLEDIGNLDGLYGRLLAIEDWSWKGLGGSGLTSFPMRRFYALMLPRLLEARSLRLSIARHNDRDVGYILGAKVGSTYRGLQFSYDNAYRSLGMGNLLQIFQMSQLIKEGITLYDLGSDAPYKDRWSDGTFDTTTFIIRR